MRAMMKIVYWVPLMALLTGCVSHLSQQQCASMNWYNEGYNDSSAGNMPRDLTSAIQDCAQYHIAVNSMTYQTGWHAGAKQFCYPTYDTGYNYGTTGKAADTITKERNTLCMAASTPLRLGDYRQGWQRGIKQFCTYDNGVMLGQQGKALPDVCPTSLQDQMLQGWNKGKTEFCQHSNNAFALGKANKPYPAACSPDMYASFKEEYDRGAAIGQRMNDLKSQEQDLDNTINDKVNRYGFNQAGTTYSLGDDKSDAAKAALQQLNDAANQKQNLENEIFNLQVMK